MQEASGMSTLDKDLNNVIMHSISSLQITTGRTSNFQGENFAKLGCLTYFGKRSALVNMMAHIGEAGKAILPLYCIINEKSRKKTVCG